MEEIFKTTPQVDSKEKNGNATKENTEKSIWFKLKNDFSQYIVKPFFEGYGKLEYPKPLSFLEDYKRGIAQNREASKMLSPEQGGPSKEQIYRAAMKFVKKMSWKERLSSQPPQEEEQSPQREFTVNKSITDKIHSELLSYGVTQEEIDKCTPIEAWDLLNQKSSIEKKEQQEKIYSIQELNTTFDTLQEMWEEAYDQMGDDAKSKEIIDLTATVFTDPVELEEFLERNINNLKPEQIFFIEMSIRMKKFRTKSKDLIYEGMESKNTDDSAITTEEFKQFSDTGNVSEKVLHTMAEKIKSGKGFSPEERDVYSVHYNDIEKLLITLAL